MNRSTPGLPVHHQLPEFTQTHVHQVGMQSSHLILCRPLLLLPPIPPSIRKKIESELEYPGQIKVNVIRETKAVVFPVVMYGSGSWTIKKAEC